MLGPLRVAPSKIIISVIIGWLGDINREKEGSKTALPFGVALALEEGKVDFEDVVCRNIVRNVKACHTLHQGLMHGEELEIYSVVGCVGRFE